MNVNTESLKKKITWKLQEIHKKNDHYNITIGLVPRID